MMTITKKIIKLSERKKILEDIILKMNDANQSAMLKFVSNAIGQDATEQILITKAVLREWLTEMNGEINELTAQLLDEVRKPVESEMLAGLDKMIASAITEAMNEITQEVRNGSTYK